MILKVSFHVDLWRLQVLDVTVSVENKANRFEGLLFDSLVVLVVGSGSKADDSPVLVVDLLPEELEVTEHYFVAFVNDEHAFCVGLYAAQATDIVQALLRVGLARVQDAEQVCVFFLVTIFQALVWVDHVHVHVRTEEDEVGDRCGNSRLALACWNLHHLVLFVRAVHCSICCSRKLDVGDGHLDVMECLLKRFSRLVHLVLKMKQSGVHFQDMIQAADETVLIIELLLSLLVLVIARPFIQREA